MEDGGTVMEGWGMDGCIIERGDRRMMGWFGGWRKDDGRMGDGWIKGGGIER